MFDISWSEILIIGIVALLVVGPKELPALLRTIGKYMGVVKKQAAEFRAQFDEAMRETEIEQLRKDVEDIKSDTQAALRDVERSVETEISDAKRELDSAGEAVQLDQPEPSAGDAKGSLADAQAPAGNGSAAEEVNGTQVADSPPPADDRPADNQVPKSGA
jgi:sec-independent protein translocase protein TatB